jgi:hypothetical protein
MMRINLSPENPQRIPYRGIVAFGVLFKLALVWGVWHSGIGWGAPLPAGGTLSCKARLVGGEHEQIVGEQTIHFSTEGTDRQEIHFQLSRNPRQPYADRVDIGVSRWFGVMYAYYDQHGTRTSTHSPIVFAKKGEASQGYRFSTEIADKRLGPGVRYVVLDCALGSD